MKNEKLFVFLCFLSFGGLFWRVDVCFFEDKPSVIGDEQCGEGQGDDEADDAQQTAPDGEAEQDDGGVQAHDVAHDLGREIDVLYGLHDGEHCQGAEHDEPKALPGVGGLDHGEDDGGDEADELQVGDKVEQADEEAEADGHREVDDEKAYAEEDAHEQGDERLSAEVGVHAVLHVLHHHACEASLAFGHQPYPSF